MFLVELLTAVITGLLVGFIGISKVRSSLQDEVFYDR